MLCFDTHSIDEDIAMFRPIAIVAAGLSLLAFPALAQDAPIATAPAMCEAPAAPGTVDGATASMEEVLAAKSAVAAFIASSDVYQSCLVDDIKVRRAAAKAAKTRFDEAEAKAVTQMINANQRDKEQVGKAFNDAVKAYKAAHPA